MARQFTTTDGQGSGALIWQYYFEIFLIAIIFAPNPFSAPRATSMADIQRLPMGSFM
jgi:hypothetical protein